MKVRLFLKDEDTDNEETLEIYTGGLSIPHTGENIIIDGDIYHIYSIRHRLVRWNANPFGEQVGIDILATRLGPED